MVKICSPIYSKENEEKYGQYFDFPYPLSSFQKHAIEGIVEGHHVLVTAHTGSGKTLPAEFAIQHFTKMGKKVIYTSPIKALSNQKYYEFTKKYPDITFGLLTGDIKTNPDADVLIMTTEILMNTLFLSTQTVSEKTVGLSFTMDIKTDLGCVIFDEVHYINDKDRGQVWEKTMLMLPLHIQMVMLSATIDNPAGFAEWIESRKGLGQDVNPSPSLQVYLASTNHRVVPLSHYGFLTTTESIFKKVKDKTTQQKIRDQTNTLIPLQDPKGLFYEEGYRMITKIRDLLDTNYVEINRKHVLNQLARHLKDQDMLPAICFVFSRKHVELCAKDITVDLLEDDSKVGYTVRRECEQIVRKLPNYQEYLQLPEYNQLVGLLEKGIGIHHSGMMPILREIVELMISKKYIKLLFATESFAIGLDCPIRTAIFTSLTKFDGSGERYLLAHEYTQMAGRAGRRGIDKVGHVVHCNNLFSPPSLTDCKRIMGGVPQTLVSKYHVSYGLILNLMKHGQTNGFHRFSQGSMIHKELQISINNIKENMDTLADKLRNTWLIIQSNRTPKAVCDSFLELEEKLKVSVNKKRKEIERELNRIHDEYRGLKQDLTVVCDLHSMDAEYTKMEETLEFMQRYILSQTTSICTILLDHGYITTTDTNASANTDPSANNSTNYSLTKLGMIAANLAEIHPLPFSKLMMNRAYFADFSPKQLVGIFSCFCDVKVPSDRRYSVPHTDDLLVKQVIEELNHAYLYYETKETDLDVRTGIRYEDALQFDIVDFAMLWCDCSCEQDCKYFIQSVISEKEISIGDFTKAMMKIVTVSRELLGVCEMVGAIDLMYKLNQIEGLVLKYVLTSQSLYL